MKEAEELAKRHRMEIDCCDDSNDSELEDLYELLNLEFIAAKKKVGELQKDEFSLIYYAVRDGDKSNSQHMQAMKEAEEQAIKKAEKLAKRHRIEIDCCDDSNDSELEDLYELLNLEFIATKKEVGSLQQDVFSSVYYAARDATPTPTLQEITPAPESDFCCPKCRSTHLTCNKKGFTFGKAIVGGVLLGGVGLLSGFIGSEKVTVTCIKCGHFWQAGKE